ncbi:hypothetical protein POTOM_057781 [Populus tomentosa]|uniref:Uncharacterized protein n=1 Tax=Populus tomentosa TaxID=118781 RepID=A0A8X7XTU1_POPTO|nr:hypothetical protein POTOM_057781 [Populus tomentosa]
MEENGGGGSHRYWVREATADAAPFPLPKKLSPQHLLSQPNSLGSVWNTAGTWEEKNLNNWATRTARSVGSLEFSSGKAQIAEVSKCSGDVKKPKPLACNIYRIYNQSK